LVVAGDAFGILAMGNARATHETYLPGDPAQSLAEMGASVCCTAPFVHALSSPEARDMVVVFKLI
jgi:hypothetical protein